MTPPPPRPDWRPGDFSIDPARDESPILHSFVVPSYNHVRYVGETIESLLAQKARISEIVVCDDGSDDGSRELIARYAGRVRVVDPPRRMGMMGNYNFAVSQARGTWVSLMGSDDRALPGFSTEIATAIAHHSEAVLVSGDFRHIDGEGRVIREERVLSVKPYAAPPENLHVQISAAKVHPAAHAFRKAAWAHVGGFDESLHLYGDWALWLRLAALGPFVHRPAFLADYRVEYRPEIGLRRLPQVLEDDVAIALRVIPEVAARVPGADAARIAAAQRARLRSRLAECSRMLSPGERGAAVETLRPWAESLGEDAMLADFAGGGSVSGGLRDTALWRFARDVYKRLR